MRDNSLVVKVLSLPGQTQTMTLLIESSVTGHGVSKVTIKGSLFSVNCFLINDFCFKNIPVTCKRRVKRESNVDSVTSNSSHIHEQSLLPESCAGETWTLLRRNAQMLILELVYTEVISHVIDNGCSERRSRPLASKPSSNSSSIPVRTTHKMTRDFILAHTRTCSYEQLVHSTTCALCNKQAFLRRPRQLQQNVRSNRYLT
jgi:hypothetical protein